MVNILGWEYPEGLYYSKDHMWVKIEDGKARVGLTEYGQHLASKILFVRLKSKGSTVKQGRILGTLESGKWVGPIKAPLSGKVVEVNEDLKSRSMVKLINEDPYGRGWIAVIEPSNLEEEKKNLMVKPEEIEPWLKKEIEKYEKK